MALWPMFQRRGHILGRGCDVTNMIIYMYFRQILGLGNLATLVWYANNNL